MATESKGKTVEAYCKFCNGVFYPRIADVERGWGKFCGRICANKAKKRKNSYRKRKRRIVEESVYDKMERILNNPVERYVSYEEIMKQPSMYEI